MEDFGSFVAKEGDNTPIREQESGYVQREASANNAL